MQVPSCICPENFKLTSSICGLIFRTERKSVHIKERTDSIFGIAMKCPVGRSNIMGLPFLSAAKEWRNTTWLGRGSEARGQMGYDQLNMSIYRAPRANSSELWLLLTPCALLGFLRILRRSLSTPGLSSPICYTLLCCSRLRDVRVCFLFCFANQMDCGLRVKSIALEAGRRVWILAAACCLCDLSRYLAI